MNASSTDTSLADRLGVWMPDDKNLGSSNWVGAFRPRKRTPQICQRTYEPVLMSVVTGMVMGLWATLCAMGVSWRNHATGFRRQSPGPAKR